MAETTPHDDPSLADHDPVNEFATARGKIWMMQMTTNPQPKQLLHFVFGGELAHLDDIEFKDLSKVDMVGVYPNYATAYAAWKAKAQQTVDNAHMRYFIVHMHRLLDPNKMHRSGAR